MMPVRLAALVSHPIQYFAPLYRELARRPDISLTVFFCARGNVEGSFDSGFGRTVQWDTPLLGGYSSRFMQNLALRPDPQRFLGVVNPAVVGLLRRGKFDALWLHGYYGASHWLAIAAARTLHLPILLRTESTKSGKHGAAHMMKAALMRNIAGALYIGSRNRSLYESFGVPAQRMHFAPYSVDNRFFLQQAELFRGQRLQLRKRFGIVGEGPCILFAGKLIAKKQPQALLQAFQAVRAKHACTLLFAGDGELRPVLEAQVRDAQIMDVHFAGFLNQTEIGAAYACADIFVLPSLYDETWGLVVNEAMNFGLPVVLSDAVGCADDLLRQRENGFVVSASRFVIEGADAIAALVADAELRRAYGARSREIIAQWDVPHTADGIVAAAHSVVGFNAPH